MLISRDCVILRWPRFKTNLPALRYDIDTEGINGFAPFVGQLKGAFGAWNASGSIPPACLARFGPDGGWKCLFGAALLPVIKTPTFVLNSK